MIKDLLEQHERLTHRIHQLEGVEALVKDVDLERAASCDNLTFRREIPGVFGLLDEVGAGKTKQIIDTAQIKYLRRDIDTMLVFTPGFARSTWADEDPVLGEVAKHAWTSVPNIVHEFHGNYTDLDLSDVGLHWIITNFEFVRRENHRDELLKLLRGRDTWVVVDESWCIKGRSDQTRACTMVRRKRAKYATILNGTPLSDGKPQDLYYQFNFLDPDIIGCKTYTQFKAKYCVMGGQAGRSVVSYQNLGELNARVAPYILSRRTRDCFDLPPMLDPITVEATLTAETWKHYRAMRDDMVVWLNNASQASVAKHAITKALRLAQITSGYLGGLESVDEDFELTPESASPIKSSVPSWLASRTGIPQPVVLPSALPGPGPFGSATPVLAPHGTQKFTKEIGTEKLDAFLKWLDTLNRPHKMLAWCRFRAELARLHTHLEKYYPTVLDLKGGQTPDQRRAVKEFLAPGGDPRPGAVTGISGTGAASLNFSAAWLMVFMSHDPALIKRTQSIGRVERPGQTSPMLIVDVVAVGPKKQKTIDHGTLKALRSKDDMARWSVGQWRKLLEEE